MIEKGFVSFGRELNLQGSRITCACHIVSHQTAIYPLLGYPV